jgi:hypothetical protein
MSAISDRALSIESPVAKSSDCILMPALGGLWVVVNVALASLGVYTRWPFACSFTAGLVNGAVLSVIAVAAASARFQAGATGLLGGLTLSGLRSDGSMISKIMQSLHGIADSVLSAIGIEGNEQFHHAIEQEALYMVWTTVFVVLALLVAEWVRAARSQG